jgi:hypothetical protein
MTYLVESRDDIQTLPHAVWLARVTATTVGYGDVTPDTQACHEVVGIHYHGSLLLSLLGMRDEFVFCSKSLPGLSC